MIDQKALAIESFDVVPFMRQSKKDRKIEKER